MDIYQKLILDENQGLMETIKEYYEEEFDQIELTRRLKKMCSESRSAKKLIQC